MLLEAQMKKKTYYLENSVILARDVDGNVLDPKTNPWIVKPGCKAPGLSFNNDHTTGFEEINPSDTVENVATPAFPFNDSPSGLMKLLHINLGDYFK